MSTSLDFSSNDICPYIIVSDSDLTFNTRMRITLKSSLNTDVYLLIGSSVTEIESQIKLYDGGSTTIPVTKVGVIIAKPSGKNPFAQFAFQNEQVISSAGYVGIIIGSTLGYFFLLIGALIYLTRRFTLQRLREMQSPNIVYYLKKKVG